jgi:hypothetical protein
MMEFIGEGMQCLVYRHSGGRVIKKLRSENEVRRRYRKLYPEFSRPNADLSVKSSLFFASSARFALNCVSNEILEGPEFAFPRVEDEERLSQVEVEPCTKAFASGHRVLDDQVLEQFMLINARLWSAGVFETTLSLDKYGFNGERLVLYDFFELGTNHEDWLMLGDLRWWRYTNKHLVMFHQDLLEKLDILLEPCFRGPGPFPTGVAAPDSCRLDSIRDYMKIMDK